MEHKVSIEMEVLYIKLLMEDALVRSSGEKTIQGIYESGYDIISRITGKPIEEVMPDM